MPAKIKAGPGAKETLRGLEGFAERKSGNGKFCHGIFFETITYDSRNSFFVLFVMGKFASKENSGITESE